VRKRETHSSEKHSPAKADDHARSSRARTMNPLRGLTFVTEAGPTEISQEDVSVDLVGWKAFGLTAMPTEWVPPFFVLANSAFESLSAETLQSWIGECLHRLGLDLDNQVMVRSSGSFETIRYRGQLPSRSCTPTEVATTVRDLMSELPNIGPGHVHWIIQEYVETKQKGQLSNERRLRLEKRDWVIEVEPEGERLGSSVPIGVRQWRDGSEVDVDLRCNSRLEVSIRLRQVAIWATRLSSRTLFEWVWDGARVWMVQADIAAPELGENPSRLLPLHIEVPKHKSLSVFRAANKQDYSKYGKLRNARLYSKLGYDMPVFYVVDDPRIIAGIISGSLPPEIIRDLEEITKRTLIIRTDGIDIAEEKREMLPRSEELGSHDEARDWLITDFVRQVKESELESKSLCLVAHHFIPSIASAWAWAEPGNRIVRIESLWGIPEGLYWYSHDTFEIDTQTIAIDATRSIKKCEYKINERLRHKGRFIGSNRQGKWIPYHTKPPFDWNASISKNDWLFEIARTTRLIAEQESHPVSVMWFIGNHPEATPHEVLPWFHSRSEPIGPINAAPRQKRKSARDFTMRKGTDWEELQRHLKSGSRVERVVVEPSESELIRNPQFARELAQLAASNRFVVELSGGLLSHVYHVLNSEGAQVECVDLFGAEEDIIEYNKVVRDNVPSIIEKRGERVETKRLANEALVTALQRKLVEEALEARDAVSGHELIGELADIEEVIRGLSRAVKFDLDDVEKERASKRKKRGGFDRGLMLTKTATPHSIRKRTASDIPTLSLRAQTESPVISNAAELPEKPSYRRPDLRQVNEQIEKLFTFETDISRIGDKAGDEVKETLNFSIPISDEQHQLFTLSIELRRAGASVRGVVRLRLLPSQLDLDFSDTQLRLDFPREESR